MGGTGVFCQAVRVGNPDGGDLVEIDALVDTGALDSMFPASLLADLRLQPLRTYTYVVADGRNIELPFGQAVLEIDGERRFCPVVFGPGDEALLGATTLEIFKLLADPNTQSLRPGDVWPLGGGRRPQPIH